MRASIASVYKYCELGKDGIAAPVSGRVCLVMPSRVVAGRGGDPLLREFSRRPAEARGGKFLYELTNA